MTAHEIQSTKLIFISSLIAGGLAGTAVDVTLFPLDTIKTRLQSELGFKKAGGCFNLYKGLLPVIIGSAPSASLFFVTYESIKSILQYEVSEEYHTPVFMTAASISEMAACIIRVPVEVIKQRRQALILDKNIANLRILYRGYWSTVFRDMPFSLIQFPLWEYFKKLYSLNRKRDIQPIESAVCGAIAGGVSAAVTTPLDVIKTRIMLADESAKSSQLKILRVLRDIYIKEHLHGLYAGLGPRVLWITLGGFVFFGTYEGVKATTIKYASHVHVFFKGNSI